MARVFGKYGEFQTIALRQVPLNEAQVDFPFRFQNIELKVLKIL